MVMSHGPGASSPSFAPDRAGRFQALRARAREAVAFARQASLIHRDTRDVVPEDASAGDDVVVLLHGLFATAGVLRPLREHIEDATGAHTASFSYAPAPGVAAVAERLAALVDRLPAGVRIHLVGHSVGGLVVRWYVQELGGDPRIVQTVSMASPFSGTRQARLLPTSAGRDILPDSVVLRRLGESVHAASSIPHLSIVAAEDSVVGVAAPDVGELVVIEDSGHNGLLYHPRVAAILAERVLAFRDVPAPGAPGPVPRRTGNP